LEGGGATRLAHVSEDQYGAEMGIVLAELTNQLLAVHIGHSKIVHENIHAAVQRGELVDGGTWTVRGVDVKTSDLQPARQDAPHPFVVFYSSIAMGSRLPSFAMVR
jgi:hypothetical protein